MAVEVTYSYINIDFGSLMSNTLILLTIVSIGAYLFHSWIKYKRLYPSSMSKQEDKQKKNKTSEVV